ncbi:hypothetical protein [Nostoc sp. FACHB-133]|uniref:hypothetical protein n=1 Tax=Nostoc sp. FACHB-133 TaxID=2692835 RepID=UPI00168911D6|nr:hypothetical protein [Nostoc sp. FACHB-133]MBD2526840.1 hypothetical protein [Nostoc sp. FACHB-133]
MLTRRTRDRFALGVGGSYGQKDYWLVQLDPASRKSHSANADSKPRVLKSWKDVFYRGCSWCSSPIDALTMAEIDIQAHKGQPCVKTWILCGGNIMLGSKGTYPLDTSQVKN